MWQDILTIHADCKEDFFNFDEFPGNADSLIACAGLSTLRTEYKIGKAEKNNVNNEQATPLANVHYLLATKSGQGKITLPNKDVILKENSIVIIPAGTPFLYELEGDHWEMCWLLLHDCSRYQFVHQLDADVFTSSDAQKLYQTMSLIREFNHSDGYYEADIILRLVEVLLYQIEQTLDNNSTLSEQQLKFHALMRRAAKQLQLPWSVSTLAEQMHISEPHFFRLCKKETGMTPIKLLTHYRLEYACYLLKYTNYNLEQIAFTIGYADAASFAHRFKQHFKLSPGRWRNSISS